MSTEARPTEAELTSYAAQLPEIYRQILAAFPAIEPNRKAGDGLAFQTMAVHFANQSVSYRFPDVRAACEQLAAGGFLEIKNGMFAHPTELGEHLIAVVANKPRAPQRSVPPLPAPTW